MNRPSILLSILLFLLAPARFQTQDAPVVPRVDAPSAGEALQGVVTVQGSTGLDGFARAELAFAYGADPTGTWFLIQPLSQPVESGPLGTWDTTLISDGIYTLRLLVTQAGGEVVEVVLPGLRVRNYTPIETSTPTPHTPQPTVEATVTPSAVPTQPGPTATALPLNPARVTADHIAASLLQGGAAAAGLFLVLALYLFLRRLGSR